MMLTGCKSNPSGIRNDVSVPVRSNEQNDGCCHTDATNKNTNKGEKPLDLQIWGEAHLRSVVQGHASPPQS